MDVFVSVAGDNSPDLLESLEDWLKGETELAGRVRVSRQSPAAGELGALAEALVVAVGSGGTLSVLATSLHAWLSQPRRSDLRIKVEDTNGRMVDITADRHDVKQVQALLRQALDFGPMGE